MLTIKSPYGLIVFLVVIYQKMRLILLCKMIINDPYLMQTKDESQLHGFMTYMQFLVFFEKNSFSKIHRPPP